MGETLDSAHRFASSTNRVPLMHESFHIRTVYLMALAMLLGEAFLKGPTGTGRRQLPFYMVAGQLKRVRRPKPALLAPAATSSNFSASLGFILVSVNDKFRFNSTVPGRGLQDTCEAKQPRTSPPDRAQWSRRVLTQ